MVPDHHQRLAMGHTNKLDMQGYRIEFENGSVIWAAASGVIRDFRPVPFGQPLEKNDIILDPEKVSPGDLLEYHDHRNGRIRMFSSAVVKVEELEEL